MLVLSRKPNERICIGDQIEVIVVAIRGNRVQLAVEAPAEVPIGRDRPRSFERPAAPRTTEAVA